VCGSACCTTISPVCCQRTSTCYATKLDAENDCQGPCVDLSGSSTTSTDGGTSNPNDPCAPCAKWVAAIKSACAAPNELSFNCYCSNAKMQKCVLDTPNCSTDKKMSQAEINRDVAAANATGGGTCVP
jgi:hypothetical protein